MKKDKTLKYLILFVIVVFLALVFFAYTRGVVYQKNGYGEIIDCSYTVVNLIINTFIIIISLAIVESSIVSIRKLPKDKNDYSKALVTANIIIGTLLNVFIIFWPIAIYIIKCIWNKLQYYS